MKSRRSYPRCPADSAQQDEVIEAFELATDENSSFLNIATGEVRMVMHDEMRTAEEGPDETCRLGNAKPSRKPEKFLDSDDWTRLPEKFDIHEWAIMERFASEETEDEIRADLRDSLHGAGAFRRFKDAISSCRSSPDAAAA